MNKVIKLSKCCCIDTLKGGAVEKNNVVSINRDSGLVVYGFNEGILRILYICNHDHCPAKKNLLLLSSYFATYISAAFPVKPQGLRE